jgi:uncharacterized protein (TIGR03084 family)
MVDLEALCSDLAAEHVDLDSVLAGLEPSKWDVDTPAPGWTVRDQVSHLAFFDEQGRLATTDPIRFNEELGRVSDADEFMNGPLRRAREMEPRDVLDWWRTERSAMLDAFRTADPKQRIPWFGPPMSPASFISARLMETWAHGQDIVDALGMGRTPTERLKHIVHLGVRARRNSYSANGLEMPDGEVRVDVRGPAGENWTWNESQTDRVTGSALDFCLVVTQRRHLEDTDLVIEGPLATGWMEIAQAFAGPPGAGRSPGQFSTSGSTS